MTNSASSIDSYFEDDAEEQTVDDDCGYQPAPGSPGQQSSDSDSDDPLEAFMAGIEVVSTYFRNDWAGLKTIKNLVYICNFLLSERGKEARRERRQKRGEKEEVSP